MVASPQQGNGFSNLHVLSPGFCFFVKTVVGVTDYLFSCTKCSYQTKRNTGISSEFLNREETITSFY